MSKPGTKLEAWGLNLCATAATTSSLHLRLPRGFAACLTDFGLVGGHTPVRIPSPILKVRSEVCTTSSCTTRCFGV